ncbi:MAG: hypothetical protein V2B18_11525 [Pseudomonadota bacterium]
MRSEELAELLLGRRPKNYVRSKEPFAAMMVLTADGGLFSDDGFS